MTFQIIHYEETYRGAAITTYHGRTIKRRLLAAMTDATLARWGRVLQKCELCFDGLDDGQARFFFVWRRAKRGGAV